MPYRIRRGGLVLNLRPGTNVRGVFHLQTQETIFQLANPFRELITGFHWRDRKLSRERFTEPDAGSA